MKIPEIPFNNYLGIQKGREGEDFLLKICFAEKYHNHLGTFHASALFALAEASSGEFLFRHFSDLETPVLPVVRKASVKYSSPATSDVRSRASFLGTDREQVENELRTAKRSSFSIQVDLLDSEDKRVMRAEIDWFVAVMDKSPA